MDIQKIPIHQINPAPYNHRADLKPNDPEYQKLKNSLEHFGYVEPLVWNRRSGTLVSGHQRIKVLLEQKIQEIEVSVVDLPLEKEKALNIALNKIDGRWDDEKLASLLEELSSIPEFNVEITGFDLPEIGHLLDTQLEDREDDFDFEAELSSIDQPLTREGDLLKLGPHRILCGDSSDEGALKRLMGKEKASLLYTDPPYNVNYDGANRPVAKGRAKPSRHWERIRSDHMNQADYELWLKKVFGTMKDFLAEGAPFYIWNGHRQFGPMESLLQQMGFHVGTVITWAKPSFALGYSDYHQQTEFSLYGWKERNGAHRWYGPTNESTLWEIQRDPVKDYIHPTQKPVALAGRAIRNSSERGEIVLDLFLGSGSTLIASQALNRRCFGLELDPRYCDALVRRYLVYAGLEGVPESLYRRYGGK